MKEWHTHVRVIKDKIVIKTKGGGKTGVKRKRNVGKRVKKDNARNAGKKTNAKKGRKKMKKETEGDKGDDDEDDEEDDEDGWGWKGKQPRRARKPLTKPIYCRDGFMMSIQADYLFSKWRLIYFRLGRFCQTYKINLRS